MRRLLLLNLLLTFVWTAVTGNLSGANLLFGFVVGSLVLLISHPLVASTVYFAKGWYAVELLGVFLFQLGKASIEVTADIISPGHQMQSGIIALPLDVRTNAEITLLANLISLTPGTLSLYLSDDSEVLFIHVMDIREREADRTRRRIKQTLERRIQRIMEPPADKNASRDDVAL